MFPAQVFSQEIPDPPVPQRLVVDYTGTLTPTESQMLERKLVTFYDTTSNQIAVVIVNSLNGLVIQEYADRLGEKWGVGKADKDNGVVMVIKPKLANEKGEAFISIGYGLEGAIPDAIAKRIVEQEMIPEFRSNNYYRGIDQGTNVLMDLAAGEYSSDEYASGGGGWGIMVPFLAIAFIYLLMRQNSRRVYSTGSHGPSLWTALWLGSMMSHGGRSGSWSDFRSGGGSFGGGGGFGGFGGGSFGGGGAGGSW